MKRFLIIGILVSALCLLVIPAQAGIRVERKSGDLSNGLVGYWTFNGADISGTTAYDRSGQGNNGTMTGGPLKVIGKLGQALNLDGVNDTVTVADHPSLDCTSAVTVSAWFYPRSLSGGWHVIAAKGIGNNSNYGLWHDGTKFSITFANGASWINHYTNQTYSPGRWYHLVGILDSANNNARLYVDGQLDIDNQTETTDTPTNNDPFYIAADYGGNWADGIIDEVRVYNRALGADEVKRLYNMGAGLKSAASQQNKLTNGLVGYWPFNGKDISGTTAYDRSGNGNNGTITGATKAIGKIGQGLSFDGLDDNSTITDVNLSSGFPGKSGTGDISFSVSTWIKIKNTAGVGKGIVSKTMPSAMGWFLWVNGAEGVTFSASVPTWAYGGTTLKYDQWYHVVGVYDADSDLMSIYLDGQLDENGAQNPLSMGTGLKVTANDVRIGTRSDGSLPFKGEIDDVRVYNRALAADEIKALYNQAGSKYHASQQNQFTTGLVGYWPFNGKDISGTTAYDRSGQGNNGTITGATKAIGKIGQGLRFDGSDDNVDAGSDSSLSSTSFTHSFWVKQNVSNGEYRISNHGSNRAFTLYADNLVRFGTEDAEAYISTTALKTATWYHVAFAYDGTTGKLFINGIQEDSKQSAIGDANGSFVIGQCAHGGHQWPGEVDDYRIYNRALSAEEIKRLYNMGR